MEDFFNRLDKATNEKNKAESERERIGRIHYSQTEQYASKLADFLKPYIAQFEERNYRCDEKLNGPYYNLRISNRENNVEIAIVNSQTQAIGFELAGYQNGNRIYINTPAISTGFDKKQMETAVQKIFENLFA